MRRIRVLLIAANNKKNKKRNTRFIVSHPGDLHVSKHVVSVKSLPLLHHSINP